MTKTIHPLLSLYSSTKWDGGGEGALMREGGAYSRGGGGRLFEGGGRLFERALIRRVTV